MLAQNCDACNFARLHCTALHIIVRAGGLQAHFGRSRRLFTIPDRLGAAFVCVFLYLCVCFCIYTLYCIVFVHFCPAGGPLQSQTGSQLTIIILIRRSPLTFITFNCDRVELYLCVCAHCNNQMEKRTFPAELEL